MNYLNRSVGRSSRVASNAKQAYKMEKKIDTQRKDKIEESNMVYWGSTKPSCTFVVVVRRWEAAKTGGGGG